MKILKIFEEIFKKSGLANVIYLHLYKEERDIKYPNAGIKPFTDWASHKKWLLEDSKQKTRKEHNDRVLKNAGKKQGKDSA